MAEQNPTPKISREEEKRKFYPPWRYLGEIYLEPLVLALALYLLAAHIQDIITSSSNLSEFWEMLNQDFSINMWAYILFGIIFLSWTIYKLKVKTWEFRDREETKKLHTEMLDILGELRGQVIIRRVSKRILRK